MIKKKIDSGERSPSYTSNIGGAVLARLDSKDLSIDNL